MHDINNSWFEDFQENVSCYTYLSFLGHDWLTPLLTCALQIAFPVLLALSSSRSYRLRLDCDLDGPEELWVGECIDAKGTGGEDWAFYYTRRTNKDAWMGRIMILLVMVFYALHVVPRQIALFYSTVVDTEGTMSRLSSLRKFVHDQDEVGGRSLLIPRVLSSTWMRASFHVCLAFSPGASDQDRLPRGPHHELHILLRALAVEFIKELDKGFTSTGWYDTDYRYLKAGAMEMVIRKYVDFHELDRLLDKPFLVDGSPVNPALTPNDAKKDTDTALAGGGGCDSGGLSGGHGGAVVGSQVILHGGSGLASTAPSSSFATSSEEQEGLHRAFVRQRSAGGVGVTPSFRVKAAATLTRSRRGASAGSRGWKWRGGGDGGGGGRGVSGAGAETKEFVDVEAG